MNTIEKHETAIELIRKIELCGRLIDIQKGMKEKWFPLFQEKADHNIQIYEGCILRFWERYQNLFGWSIMPKELKYRGMTIEKHSYSSFGWYFFDKENYDGEPVTSGKTLTEIKSLIDDFYFEMEGVES